MKFSGEHVKFLGEQVKFSGEQVKCPGEQVIFPGEQLIWKVRRCVYFSATVDSTRNTSLIYQVRNYISQKNNYYFEMNS